MATRTFCDICGDEDVVKRIQMCAGDTILKDFGEVCPECTVDLVDAAVAQRVRKMAAVAKAKEPEPEPVVGPAPEPEPVVGPAPEPEPDPAPAVGPSPEPEALDA